MIICYFLVEIMCWTVESLDYVCISIGGNLCFPSFFAPWTDVVSVRSLS